MFDQNALRGFRVTGQPNKASAHQFTLLPTANSRLEPRAALAHALKNRLATVCAVHRVLASEISGCSVQRVSRSLHAVQRMMRLIEEDLFADGVGRCLSEPAFVLVAEIMEEIRLRATDLAESRRVQLHLRCGFGGLYADGQELAEGLGNVVVNAIEASSPGGAVVVQSAESVDGGQLWTVRDTGRGIPRDEIGRSGTPCPTRRRRGSGLGLTVARDIFERHGGLAQIESAPGAGTVVSVWLPLAPPSHPAQ